MLCTLCLAARGPCPRHAVWVFCWTLDNVWHGVLMQCVTGCCFENAIYGVARGGVAHDESD